MQGKRDLPDANPDPGSRSILCRHIRRKICTEQTNRSDMLMSTYLSGESRCDLVADGNVDLDNRLLDDEDDEEEEGMINADSCQRLESHENEAPEESLLEEKIARCKRLVELKQRHRALISNRRLSLCGIPQRLRASQMHARSDDENTRLSIS